MPEPWFKRKADIIWKQIQSRAEADERRIDNKALKRLLMELVQEKLEEEQEEYSFVFPAWRTDIDVVKDEKRQYKGLLYKCLQPHTTQINWTPDKASSLWVRIAEPGEIPDWYKPEGSHDAWNTGDKVKHNDKIWKSTIDGNTTEPGTLPEHGYWVEVD